MVNDDFKKGLSYTDDSFFADKPIESRPIPLLSSEEKQTVCGKRTINVFSPTTGVNHQIVYYCRNCDSCKQYKKTKLLRKLREALLNNGGFLFATVANNATDHRRLVRGLNGEYTSVALNGNGTTPFMLGRIEFSLQKLALESFTVNEDELKQLFSNHSLSDSSRVSGNLHKKKDSKGSQKNRREGGLSGDIIYREIRGDINPSDMLKAQAIAVKNHSTTEKPSLELAQEIITSRQQAIVRLLSSWGYDVYLSSEKKVNVNVDDISINLLQSVNMVAENIPEETPADIVASIREQERSFHPQRVKINSQE
jgi:hypothetical protein